MSLTIKDAFLKKNNKFIIIITHINGLNTESIINLLINDLGLNVIKFYDNNYDILNNNINSIINKNQTNINLINNKNSSTYNDLSIAILSHSIPIDSIKFKPNLHIHLSISKTKYLNIFTDKTKTDYDNDLKLIINNKINKYFNIKDDLLDSNNNILDNKLDDIFDYIIDYWHYNLYNEKRLKNDNINSEIDSIKTDSINSESKSESINSESESINSDNIENEQMGGYKIFYNNPMKRLKKYKYKGYRRI